jgi:Diadenosine tetraphosphate (Ap4A) hydrolase and other HIT family hydrolases
MDNCIFCKIIQGDIPCSKVYEDEKIIAFNDINPEAPIHVIIIPKEHINSVNDLTEANADIVSYIFVKTKEIANKLGIGESGYRLVSNCGEHGGQTVQHLHFHLLGGRLLSWPPG